MIFDAIKNVKRTRKTNHRTVYVVLATIQTPQNGWGTAKETKSVWVSVQRNESTWPSPGGFCFKARSAHCSKLVASLRKLWNAEMERRKESERKRSQQSHSQDLRDGLWNGWVMVGISQQEDTQRWFCPSSHGKGVLSLDMWRKCGACAIEECRKEKVVTTEDLRLGMNEAGRRKDWEPCCKEITIGTKHGNTALRKLKECGPTAEYLRWLRNGSLIGCFLCPSRPSKQVSNCNPATNQETHL